MAIQTFESAYPGSMFERKDGGYLAKTDFTSLAESLVAAIKERDQQIEDLTAALSFAKKRVDYLERENTNLTVGY